MIEKINKVVTMAKNPTVSVIIPTYNRAHLIDRAIQSVSNQTYHDFEIIVVDDASTDNTEEIVKSFNDEKIIYLRHETNRGAQAARNTGIKAARGDWIAFLDSDDEWLPEKLELQSKVLLNQNKPCIVHGDALVFIEKDNITRECNLPKLQGFVYKEVLKGQTALYPCILAPKECFEKIGFLDEKVPSFQEWDTSILLSKYYEFIFLDKPLMVYHILTEETISKDKIKGTKGAEYIVDKYKEDIIKMVGKKVLAKHYAWVAFLYYRAHNWHKTKIYLIKALSKDTTNSKWLFAVMLSLFGRKIFDLGYELFSFFRSLYIHYFKKRKKWEPAN